MKDDNYFVVHGWMVNHLKLEGTELMIYSIIYGFSQDGESVFKGSISYLEKAVNKSRNSVKRAIKLLIGKNFIHREEVLKYGQTFYLYKNLVDIPKLTGGVNFERGLSETDKGLSETAPPLSETDPNKIVNKIVSNISIDKGLFPSMVSEKSFQESEVYDFKKFQSKLEEQKNQGIDLVYYFHAVDDWSEGLPQKDKRKRKTNRGWVAQARSFMRSDNEKKKLKLLSDNSTKTIDDDFYLRL